MCGQLGDTHERLHVFSQSVMKHGFISELVAELVEFLFGLFNDSKKPGQLYEHDYSGKILTLIKLILQLVGLTNLGVNFPFHEIVLLHDGHSFLDGVCGLGLSCLSNALQCIFVVFEDGGDSLALLNFKIEDSASKLIGLDDLQYIGICSVELIRRKFSVTI